MFTRRAALISAAATAIMLATPAFAANELNLPAYVESEQPWRLVSSMFNEARFMTARQIAASVAGRGPSWA